MESKEIHNALCEINDDFLDEFDKNSKKIKLKNKRRKQLISAVACIAEADYWELRSANADDETAGIVYYARIDIYKLKNFDTDEAVACKISFNGETKEYKYIASDIIYPSWQP